MQDATPITAMELSTKQVQACSRAQPLNRDVWPDLPRRNLKFYFFSPPFSATAVLGLGSWRLADAAAPLRGLRESLRRVLPGPGPLLRLGRHRVFQILSHRQEVGGRARRLNICPLYFPSVFAELKLFLRAAPRLLC